MCHISKTNLHCGSSIYIEGRLQFAVGVDLRVRVLHRFEIKNVHRDCERDWVIHRLSASGGQDGRYRRLLTGAPDDQVRAGPPPRLVSLQEPAARKLYLDRICGACSAADVQARAQSQVAGGTWV